MVDVLLGRDDANLARQFHTPTITEWPGSVQDCPGELARHQLTHGAGPTLSNSIQLPSRNVYLSSKVNVCMSNELFRLTCF